MPQQKNKKIFLYFFLLLIIGTFNNKNLDKIKFVNDNNEFENEFNKLWIHGLIHLFGHKHKKDKDFKIMSSIEKKYLKFLN